MVRSGGYLNLIRQRSFGSVWLGQLVSQSGDAVFEVAILWYVLSSTGSVALVGVINAVSLLPSILVRPVAGVYADTLNRRDLMIASNLFQGAVTAIMAALYLLGFLSFFALGILVLALLGGAQFFQAAFGAIFPRLVTKDEIAAANGLSALTGSTNQSFSYAFGGAILALLGVSVSIVYDSFTFFFAALMVFFVVRSLGNIERAHADDSEGEVQRPSFGKRFVEGARYVKESALLKEFLVFVLLVNMLLVGLSSIQPAFVKQNLHGDALAYGIVLASSSVGSILGSLAIGKVNLRGYVGKLLFAGAFVTGLLVAAVGLTVNIPEAVSVYFIIGLVITMVNVSLGIMMQTMVPNEIRGRTSTITGSLSTVPQPLAALLFGFLGGFVSLPLLYEISGLILMVVVAGLCLPFRHLRGAKN